MTGFVHQTLRDLLQKIPIQILASSDLPDQPVTGIAFDSRAVQPGSVFVPLMGQRDGHDFIPEALKKGAIAVVGSKPLPDPDFPYVQVPDTRQALAYLSAAFYSFPARQMTMIGVTGTDGKTTTATLIYQILLAAGLNAGIISTISAVIGGESIDTGFHVTTPEAPDVQRYLARMLDAGLTHVVLEATSHGLAQQRVTACEFDVAIVTNITHEHLDYHGSFEAYRAAKARLFTGLAETTNKLQGNPRLAILNRDDSSYDYLNEVISTPRLAYSLRPGAPVWAEDIRQDDAGLSFTAHGPGFALPVTCALVGDYNVSNCLAAIAATVTGLGISPETAARGIVRMHGVPGRMEKIDLGQDFTAIVDFAHTPNALRVTLETARRMTQGRVIAVFGSAGLRDRAKRRLMAEVSGELADLTILTAEDPRTESLDDILAEMAEAARARGAVDGATLFQVADRGQAIRQAVEAARPGDLVIACGKGHEQSMCFGTTEYPWDDRTAMNAALSRRLGNPGSSHALATNKRSRMSVFISLLRGVNVGGKTVRMAELKTIYEGLGFGNIRSYLQSGNVLFDSSEQDGGALASAIEAQMARTFGFSTSVLLRSVADLKRVIQGNPFVHGRMEDPARLHVTFLKGTPAPSRVSNLKAPEGETDEFAVGEQEVYLFCPNGYGRTKLSNAFLERKLDVIATTRNWNTVTALLAMAGE